MDSKTIFVEPNQREFRNHIFRLPDEINESYVDQLRSAQVFKKYDKLIQDLCDENSTIEQRGEVELNYIKKDLEYITQCYFNNYINYPEYLAGIHNIISAFNIIRHNWSLQHPAKEEDKKL